MADKALEAKDRALEAKDRALEANKVADMALAAASRAVKVVRVVRVATVVDGAAGIVVAVAVAVALREAWLVRELSAWTGKVCVRPKWSRTSLKMASRFRSS
jgi:predicted oxidoreductase